MEDNRKTTINRAAFDGLEKLPFAKGADIIEIRRRGSTGQYWEVKIFGLKNDVEFSSTGI